MATVIQPCGFKDSKIGASTPKYSPFLTGEALLLAIHSLILRIVFSGEKGKVSEDMSPSIIPGKGVSSDSLFLTGGFLGCKRALGRRGGEERKEGTSSSITSEKLFLSCLQRLNCTFLQPVRNSTAPP